MGFGPGLARIACQCCQTYRLTPVRELLENARTRCVSCGEDEAVAHVEARDAQLAGLLNIIRELDLCGRRAAGREAPAPSVTAVLEKERL